MRMDVGTDFETRIIHPRIFHELYVVAIKF
jgi:hypothetical protein